MAEVLKSQEDRICGKCKNFIAKNGSYGICLKREYLYKHGKTSYGLDTTRRFIPSRSRIACKTDFEPLEDWNDYHMKKRVNPNRIPMSKADVQRAKNEATDCAVTLAWSIFFTCLRDKEGYDLDDLKRVWGEIEDLSDSITKGYCTVQDLREILEEEAGVSLK